MKSDFSGEKRVTRKIQRILRSRMELVGEFVEGAAKLRCPVDTGNLRGSINHKVIRFDLVRIGTPVEYAPYVELGTRYQAAQPYLRPAVYENKAEIKRILAL